MGKKTIDIPPGRVSIIREGGVEKRMGKGHVGESKKIERPARKPGDYQGVGSSASAIATHWLVGFYGLLG